MASLQVLTQATQFCAGYGSQDTALFKLKFSSLGEYSGLTKFSPSTTENRHDTRRPVLRRANNPLITARGTQKLSTAASSSKSGKKNLGTRLFKQKEEEVTKKDGFLAIRPSTFPNLQLFGGRRQAEENTVFVANADGKTGSRIVLELLRDGFKVRAGVPDIKEAQKIAEFASQYGIISSQEVKRLNVVEFTTEEPELIAKAIGNASKVVVTLGSGEQGPTGTVTAADASQIVEASALAKVASLVLVTTVGNVASSSEGPGSFFAKIFAFFSGKAAASKVSFEELLDQIVDTDISYTIVRAAPSENVPDSYGSTAPVVVSKEGEALGGKISKFQIASVVSTALSNAEAAANKIFEVSASPEAESVPIINLLSNVAPDGRRQALAEQKAREKAQEEAFRVAEEARAALEAAERLEREARKLSAEESRAAALAEQARARADAATASVSSLAEDLKAAGGEVSVLSKPKFSFPGPKKAAVAEDEKDEEEDSGNGGFSFSGFASKLSLPKKVADEEGDIEKKPVSLPDFPKFGKSNGKKSGTIFGQETIYVDEKDAGDF